MGPAWQPGVKMFFSFYSVAVGQSWQLGAQCSLFVFVLSDCAGYELNILWPPDSKTTGGSRASIRKRFFIRNLHAGGHRGSGGSVANEDTPLTL